MSLDSEFIVEDVDEEEAQSERMRAVELGFLRINH